MSKTAHIHVIDGKQIAYPDGQCPFCNPQVTAPQQQVTVPTVYRKGNTVVLKISKGTMGTTTYWTKENSYLMSFKRLVFGTDRKVVRDNTGKPVWNNITMRVNADLLKQFIKELSSLINDMESGTGVPQRS